MKAVLERLNASKKEDITNHLKALNEAELDFILDNCELLTHDVFKCLAKHIDSKHLDRFIGQVKDSSINIDDSIIEILAKKLDKEYQVIELFSLPKIKMSLISKVDRRLLNRDVIESIYKNTNNDFGTSLIILRACKDVDLVRDFIITHRNDIKEKDNIYPLLTSIIVDSNSARRFITEDIISTIGIKKLFLFIEKYYMVDIAYKIIIDKSYPLKERLNYFSVIKNNTSLIEKLFSNEEFLKELSSTDLLTFLALINSNDALKYMDTSLVLDRISDKDLNSLCSTIPRSKLVDEFNIFSKSYILDRLTSKVISDLLIDSISKKPNINYFKKMIYRMSISDILFLLTSCEKKDTIALVKFISKNYNCSFCDAMPLINIIEDSEKGYEIYLSDEFQSRLDAFLRQEKIYNSNAKEYVSYVVRYNRDFSFSTSSINIFKDQMTSRFSKEEILLFSSHPRIVNNINHIINEYPKHYLDALLTCFNVLKEYYVEPGEIVNTLLEIFVTPCNSVFVEYLYKHFCTPDYLNKIKNKDDITDLEIYLKGLLDFSFLLYSSDPENLIRSITNISPRAITKDMSLNESKNYYLKCCFGTDLVAAERLIKKFGDFIINIKRTDNQQEQKVLDYFKHLKKIVGDDFNNSTYYRQLLENHLNGNKVVDISFLETLAVPDTLKRLYAKTYLTSLSQIPKNINKKEPQVIEAPDDFRYLVSVFNAVGSIPLIDGDYKKSWNTSYNYRNKGISTSYITNHNMGIICYGEVILGFIPKNDDFILAMSVNDIFAGYDSENVIETLDEFYVDASKLPSESRYGYNELVMNRYKDNNHAKVEPDYVLFIANKNPSINTIVRSQCEKCAADFGVPLIVIDAEKVEFKERECLEHKIEELVSTDNVSPSLIQPIVDLIISNYVGFYTLHYYEKEYLEEYQTFMGLFTDRLIAKMMEFTDEHTKKIWLSEIEMAVLKEQFKLSRNSNPHLTKNINLILDAIVSKSLNAEESIFGNDVNTYKGMVSETFLGGRGQMYETTMHGKTYLFKPAYKKHTTKTEPFRAYASEIACNIQKMVNKENVVDAESCYFEIDGELVFGLLQRKIKADASKTIAFRKSYENGFRDLKTSDIAQLLREFVVDYLMGNYDTNASNFIVDNKGRIFGIDKENSLKTVLDLKLDIDTAYNPKGLTVYNALFDSALKGYITLDFTEIEDIAISLRDITSFEYLEMFSKYIDSVLKDTDTKSSYDEYEIAILERKRELLSVIEELKSRIKVAKEKGFK